MSEKILSEKILSEKIPYKEAPSKDGAGRTIVAEQALLRAAEEDAPDMPVVILTAPGVSVQADDLDGEGLARALSTLAAMVPG